jgi:predicted ATPase
LGALIDQSLVQAIEPAGAEDAEPRVTMLETIHEYGWEQLAACGEEARLRCRHAAYFLELAERVAPELRGARQEHWMASLAREHDNLREALGWARQSGDTAGGGRMAAALWRFWYLQGHLTEGRRWLEGYVDGAGQQTPARAAALHGACVLAESQGDYARRGALGRQSWPLS